MARTVSGAGKVGDFVVFEPFGFRQSEEGLEHGEREFFVARLDFSPLPSAVERGRRLVGEGVGREVADGEGQSRFDLLLPIVELLPGQAIDEIEAEVVDAGSCEL